MIKIIIAAKSNNNVIGRNNNLVWHMPADMKFFKNKTMGHWVIMGRKTFESLGKPLPGRPTIIITRKKDYRYEGCQIANNMNEAFQIAKKNQLKSVFILGGEEIYRQTIHTADKMYITEIHSEFEGDAFFPEIDPKIWYEVSREDHPSDEKNKYSYAFVTYERRES